MIDLSAADGDIERRADVCIVGAGVAGQTLARRLAGHGRSVIIAESGGADFDRATQALAAGPNLGFDYYDLEESRLRLYGGTTAIWGGRSVALDRIDFERRDWVPHSGWPVGYEELDPFVDEAFADLDLRRPRGWADIGASPPPFDPARIDAPLWSFDDRGERFTNIADLDLTGLEIALNATLVRIDAPEGGAVTGLAFSSLNGRRLTVRADSYVLAAGGIETPRLMLACAPDRPEGIGNGHDLVGRFFMEHPHARGGQVTPAAPTMDAMRALLALTRQRIWRKGRRYAAVYRPAEAAQRKLGILNSALSLAIRRHEGRPEPRFRKVLSGLKHGLPAKRRFRTLYRGGKNLVNRMVPGAEAKSSARSLLRRSGNIGLYAVIRAEQAPNPDSRVRLVDDRDALGVRRAGLDWRLSPIDRRSVAGLMDLLGEEMRRTGLGEAYPATWLTEGDENWRIDPLISAHAIGGYHHMGTTRMAATPREGVTDADCRVFESPNLYIAGSSLFPTAGWANPTITIIALAKRLGDHIDRELDAGP